MMETGAGILNPLFFMGVVENNVDERLEGRVQVRAFGVHGTTQQVPTENLPWATLVHGSYDPNAEIPRVNSFVFGFFVDGRDAQQPMILGLIPTQMTEIINPDLTGWGKIPETNSRILAKRSMPPDIGQPSNSRLVRGENIEETYVHQQEISRVKDIGIADQNPDKAEDGDREFFAEPAPAYNAEYPFNRVIETATHSIELDDTPGAERITIYHGAGSYIAIDARGSTTHKSASDKIQINDRNNYVYVKGRNIVTIEGDSQVLVKGNKIEEITGDLIQNVRGNHYLSVGGQSTINASEEIQIRGGKLRLESNVEGINLKASKKINLQAVDAINLKAKTMYLDAEGDLSIKAEHPKIAGESQVSISAELTAIDDYVRMAEGLAVEPDSSGAGTAEAVDAPEPVGKAISTTRNESYDGGIIGSSGYTSQDEGEESVERATATETSSEASTSSAADAIKKSSTGIKTSAAGLENDQAFQTKLAEMQSKYPGLEKQQLYAIISGESAFNTAAYNQNSGASGLFQFIPSTAKGLGYTTSQIRNMNPTQQLEVYDKYLASAKYNGGDLGIIQAAPAYYGRGDNFEVYKRGSKAYAQNPPWRGSDGRITVGSINAYYNKNWGLS